ncbi:MAG: hypothetical protein HKN17_08590 [Rhodothermales bacterium]|nr:hypothetical protein [Rhodothermales bacterium]
MERYYVVIALTFIGFVALAAILLVPVYLFLKREEDVARQWTDETVARDARADGGAPDRPNDETAGSRSSG